MTYDNTTPNADEALVVNERQKSSIDGANDHYNAGSETDDGLDVLNGVVPDELSAVSECSTSSISKPSTSSASSASSSISDPTSLTRSNRVVTAESNCSTETQKLSVERKIKTSLEEVQRKEIPEAQNNGEHRDEGANRSSASSKKDGDPLICYDAILDNEIRNRLDKLNALSDLINSLELQFDNANIQFRDTLKCSTERLSVLAKTLGSKSIRQGRLYHAAKLSVEKTQSDCQRACVQFEQANNDHQFAKQAIKDAELKLREINSANRLDVIKNASSSPLCLSMCDLKIEVEKGSYSICSSDPKNHCDSPDTNSKSSIRPAPIPPIIGTHDRAPRQVDETSSILGSDFAQLVEKLDKTRLQDSAKLSEDLNQAIIRLVDAEEKRRQSEMMHLDQANKLMIAQENLTKLEREYGTSIKRAQVYFDEAKQFNAKLSSVKSDIARISEEIAATKQAYARTLNELEQFSEDLHISSRNLLGTQTKADS